MRWERHVLECLVKEAWLCSLGSDAGVAVGPCKSHGACFVRHVRQFGSGTKGRKGESKTVTYVCFLKSWVCILWMHKHMVAEAWV